MKSTRSSSGRTWLSGQTFTSTGSNHSARSPAARRLSGIQARAIERQRARRASQADIVQADVGSAAAHAVVAERGEQQWIGLEAMQVAGAAHEFRQEQRIDALV